MREPDFDIPALSDDEPLPVVVADCDLSPTHHPLAVQERRHRHWMVLAGGLSAGVVADRYMESSGPALFLLTVIAVVAGVLRHRHRGVPGVCAALLVAAAFFATMTGLRDAPGLVFLNSVMAVMLISLAASPGTSSGLLRLGNTTITQLVLAGARSGLHSALGPIRVGDYRSEPLIVRDSSFKLGVSVFRSTIIALAAAMSIGVLLAQGDPAFAQATSALTRWSSGALVEHVFITLFIAWFVTGLSMAAAGLTHATWRGTIPELPVLNRLDVVTTLGALNAVFAFFVFVQFRVLVGGAEYLRAATGLTVAEYARNGFFTLVVVAGLTIAILVALDARFGRDSLAVWKPAQRLSFTMLGMVGLVMASAATRMTLYVTSFGLSIDRITAFWIIGWLALVCAWFGATVLMGRSRRFVAGAMASGAAVLAAMTLTGHDRLVVRDAISRAARAQSVDVEYVTRSLSADAVPMFLAAVVSDKLPILSTSVADRAASCGRIIELMDRWGSTSRFDANVSRYRARAAVARHRATIEGRCGVDR